MRCLFLHCKHYGSSFYEFATRPAGIQPEKIIEPSQEAVNCLTVLVTVEAKDDYAAVVPMVVREILKSAADLKPTTIAILPFAHLSNNLAPFKNALETLENIVAGLRPSGITIIRAHFGSHKTLLLDIYGHPGNVRYREF